MVNVESSSLTLGSGNTTNGSGQLVFQDSTLTNNGAVLAAEVTARGTFGATGSAFGANVNLEGATVSGSLDLDDTLTVQTTGQSTLTAGTSVDVAGMTNINEGSFVISAAAILFGIGDVNTAAGAELRVNGQLDKDVFIEGGAIFGGEGIVSLNAEINGTLDPGNSAGTLGIEGTITLTPISTTVIEIGGTTAGEEHDQVVGQANTSSLAGFLQVALIDEFTPTLDDEFVIFRNYEFANMFDNVVEGRVHFDRGSFLIGFASEGIENQLVLSNFSPVSEPSSYLVLLGLALLASRRRRR